MLTREDEKALRRIFCEVAEEVIILGIEKIIKQAVRNEFKRGFDRYEKSCCFRKVN